MVRTTKALDHEWDTHYAHSEAGRQALQRWTETEVVFDGMVDLACVLTARRDDTRAPDILGALGRLASSDPIAARTLFQAMLPGLVDLALRRFGDHRGAVEEIMPIAWLRVSTYPGDRPGSVAGNILLDVAKRYLRTRELASPSREVLTGQPGLDVTVPSAEEVVMDSASVFTIERAASRGVISEQAVDLIVRTRVEDVSLDEIAAEIGTTSRYAQCLRRRAEHKLRRRYPTAA